MPQRSDGSPHGWQLQTIRYRWQAQGPKLLEPTIAVLLGTQPGFSIGGGGKKAVIDELLVMGQAFEPRKPVPV